MAVDRCIAITDPTDPACGAKLCCDGMHHVPWCKLHVDPVGCYCAEDEGAGYTYDDEHGPCDVCLAIEERCRNG